MYWRNNFKLMYICALIFCEFTETIETISAVHTTKEAQQKMIDLYCYKCDSMIDGDKCQDIKENVTSLSVKCPGDQKSCKVNRISMTASGEDLTGKPKLWLLRRNCTKTCEPGCIVIGERTKLHSCTTCCENNYCNIGSGAKSIKKIQQYHLAVLLILLYMVIK